MSLPAADCDLSKESYRQYTAGLTDNSLEIRPISEFCEGDVHPSVAGTARISNEVADQVLTLMRRDGFQVGLPTNNAGEIRGSVAIAQGSIAAYKRICKWGLGMIEHLRRRISRIFAFLSRTKCDECGRWLGTSEHCAT